MRRHRERSAAISQLKAEIALLRSSDDKPLLHISLCPCPSPYFITNEDGAISDMAEHFCHRAISFAPDSYF
jgi:hypothetical protein